MSVAAVTKPTFAGVEAALVAATSAGAKLELIAQLQLIMNLLPAEGSATTPTPPDFDVINPSVSAQLLLEMQQLQYAIQQGA